LLTTVKNQNLIKKFKSRLKSCNACYHSVLNILFSSLLSKNLNIKINRTVFLPVVLCVCVKLVGPLKEQRRMRLFENGVFRRIFWPMRDEVTGSGKEK
jgi:hypothetical protein